MLVNFMERHLLISDAAPGRIPAIGDEDVDLAITSEKFRQLIFNELNLRRRHVEMTNVIAQRQNRIIKPHPQASLAEGIYVRAYNIDRIRCLRHACSSCLCRPDAEAIVMPGCKTTPGH